MEKEFIGLVFSVLLIGLVGGYVFGHIIYQPKIRELENQINAILLYESPIKITSAVLVGSSLSYNVSNNGEQMEYLTNLLTWLDPEGNPSAEAHSSAYSKMIFPQKEVTINADTHGLHEAGQIIEVWTYDGDSARAIVEGSS